MYIYIYIHVYIYIQMCVRSNSFMASALMRLFDSVSSVFFDSVSSVPSFSML